MFGYVTIEDNQMTQEEYEVFSAYYCGVCRATGERVSQIARLALSYDITFLAIVLDSFDESSEFGKSVCMAHPFSKRRYVANSKALEYAAAAGAVLTYLKFKDDFCDERSVAALLGIAGFGCGTKKAKLTLSREYSIIEKQLAILSEYEKNGSTSLDDTADAFGKILAALFTPDFITDKKQRRALEWLGFNLGKWIYMIDAVNDLEKDIKSGSYNALAAMGYTDREACAKDMELVLTLTLDGVATAFELLNVRRYRDLIAKIIYISLKEKQQRILKGERKDKNEPLRSSRSSGKCGR